MWNAEHCTNKYQKITFKTQKKFSLTLHLWYELRGVNTNFFYIFLSVVVGLIKKEFFLLSLLFIEKSQSVWMGGRRKITKMKCVHWIVCCIFLVALLDSTDEDIIECKEKKVFFSEIWEFNWLKNKIVKNFLYIFSAFAFQCYDVDRSARRCVSCVREIESRV